MFSKLPFPAIVKHVSASLSWAGTNAFLGFLVLLLLALILSSGVFYRYVFILQDIEIEPLGNTRFRSVEFQNILRTWNQRSEVFERAGQQAGRDIFAPPD